ncbi:hypothetical protein WMY93_012031 [Mugilogobius chulae]|uniref:UPAR/Ly6 domain-containing protein n=1 Tax=Mugilogobius chulae TaxID=88201 RepID=A0AAW0P4L4_9GOBI
MSIVMETSLKQLSFIVLLSCLNSAAGLECMTCDDFSCSSQSPKTCHSSETLCITESFNNSGSIIIMKGCTSENMKCSNGGVFYSYNYGSYYRHFKSMCCDSDNCNAGELPIPAPPAGSLQCYGCDPHKYDCTANVSCTAQEVCGGMVMSGTQPKYGCFSENLCHSELSSLVFSDDSHVCCNSSHCNVPELGLQCNTCSDESCSTEHTVTCFKNSPCYTYTRTYIDSDQSNRTMVDKGCITDNLCSVSKPELFTFNSLSSSMTMSCCGSDHCNADVQPAPPAGALQCYSCRSYTEDCSSMRCDAGQSCAHIPSPYYMNNRDHFGCVSDNLCNTHMLQISEISRGQLVSCCNTTNCNNPAAGLSCITCTDPNDPTCATTISYPCQNGETKCVSAIVIATTATSGSSTQKIKGCAPSTVCPATGSQDYSLDLGTANVLARAECCNTDNCNFADASTPTTPADGSLQCYSCDPTTGSCSNSITCNTKETNCFSSTMIPLGSSSPVPAHGCVSGNLCLIKEYLSIYPLFKNIGSIQETPTCCNTANCNPLITTTTLAPTTTTVTPTPTTTTTKNSRSVAFLQMSIKSLQALSNETLAETIKQFFKEQLNRTDHVVKVKQIVRTQTEITVSNIQTTNLTTSAPAPTKAPPSK